MKTKPKMSPATKASFGEYVCGCTYLHCNVRIFSAQQNTNCALTSSSSLSFAPRHSPSRTCRHIRGGWGWGGGVVSNLPPKWESTLVPRTCPPEPPPSPSFSLTASLCFPSSLFVPLSLARCVLLVRILAPYLRPCPRCPQGTFSRNARKRGAGCCPDCACFLAETRHNAPRTAPQRWPTCREEGIGRDDFLITKHAGSSPLEARFAVARGSQRGPLLVRSWSDAINICSSLEYFINRLSTLTESLQEATGCEESVNKFNSQQTFQWDRLS